MSSILGMHQITTKSIENAVLGLRVNKNTKVLQIYSVILVMFVLVFVIPVKSKQIDNIIPSDLLMFEMTEYKKRLNFN